MLRWILVLIVAAAVAEELPFWKGKPKVHARVQSGEVIVSVKSSAPLKPFAHRLGISGGGEVRAPADFVFAYAQDFDKIARLSGYIQNAVYHKETGTVDATISALGHRADVQIRVKAVDGEPSRIEFEIRKGPMTGLKSRLQFRALAPAKTEVGIEGEYSYDRFPIPKFFMEFGMEVVFQKMAVRLRQQVESAYRAERTEK